MSTLEMVRQKIEDLYTHTCTITEKMTVRDPVKKTTTTKDVVVYENQPCRISYVNQNVDLHDLVNSSTSVVKLFIGPEIEIKEGSRVIADVNGNETTYTCSSTPFIYTTHREYLLRFDRAVL